MLTTAFLLAASILTGQAEKAPPAQDVAGLLQTAAVHSTRKQYAEAESCYRKVLEILGEDNKDALKTVVLMADAIGKQTDRSIEACELLEEALKKQRPRLGDDNADVQEVIRSIVSHCHTIAWTRSIKTDGSADEYATALKHAARAVELNREESWSWLLALAKLRSGDAAGSLQAMQESLQEGSKEQWIGQYFVMSLVEAANGNKQAARDWYAAGCEWMDKEKNTWEPNNKLRAQSAKAANMPVAFSPDDWSREDYLACFERLVAKQPESAQLIYRRGVRHAAGKDWEKALADFDRAAALKPENFRFAETVAAVRLFTEASGAKTGICRELIDKWKDSQYPSVRMDMVVMCSLAPEADLDRKALLDIAEKALEGQELRDFLLLGKGMALYRCGRFEEAVDVLPDYKPYGDDKNRLLAVLFRAMTHYRVGDAFASKRLLKTAQEDIEQRLQSPDGPLARYQDRPIVWCMVQMALREAEALVAGGA
jgi:tetratricopeptide (TPR) repeat protein